MNIIELTYKDKVYTNSNKILDILRECEFYWLIDSELSEAVIEIVNNTLIWKSGSYLYGNWKYGIFKRGNFYGVWENGIFEGGTFSGVWMSGIKVN